jgi:hypothetical protein
MAGEKDQVQIVVDLDTSEAIKKLSGLSDKITDSFEPKKADDLIGSFKMLAVQAFAAVAVFETVKKALEAIFEAEQIKAINQQFEVLAKNAGVAGAALKKGLEEAADGLADDTDLLKAANQALVSMGSNAADLPKTLDLARKVTAAFGGDLLQNFETLNQAIATGNTRMLKQFGIIVDTSQAVKDYAKANGLAANELSKAGEQAALFQTITERGNKALAGVDLEVTKSKNAFDRLLVSLNQFKEAIILAFEKVAGPTVEKFFSGLNDMVGRFKTYLVSSFGEGVEKASATVEKLTPLLSEYQAELEKLEAMSPMQQFWEGAQARIPQLKRSIEEIKTELVAAQQEVAAAASSAPAQEVTGPDGKVGTGGAEADAADKELRKQNLAKFNQEILQMEMAKNQALMQTATEFQQFEDLQRQQKATLEEQYLLQIEQIKLKPYLREGEAQTQILALTATHNAQMAALDSKLKDDRIRFIEEWAKRGQSATEQFSRGFQKMGLQAQADLGNLAKQGEFVSGVLTSHLVSAFTEIGKGSKNGADIMKGFLLGTLADIALQYGTVLTSMGIGLGDPVKIAAGAALLALGGLLKGLAGSQGGATTVSSGASSGGSAASYGGGREFSTPGSTQTADKLTPMDSTETVSQQEQKKKTVTVQIQGNYFETEETRRKLMDMIRSESDATDFRYVQVGQS